MVGQVDHSICPIISLGNSRFTFVMKRYLIWVLCISAMISVSYAQEKDSVLGKKLYQEGLSIFGSNPKMAIQKLKNARSLLREAGPWDIYVHTLAGITFYYQKIDVNFDSARKYTNLAFEGANTHLEPEHDYYGMALNNKNVLDLQLGAFSQARDNFQFMLEKGLYDKSDSASNLAYIYNNLGQCYSYLGDYDEAMRYFQQAFHLIKKTDPPKSFTLANQHNQIAKVYERTQEWEKAISHYNEAIILLDPAKAEHHRYLIDFYHSLANIHLDNGDPEKALAYLDSAQTLQKISPEHLYTNSRILAMYYLKKGDYENAIMAQNKNVDELTQHFKTRKRHHRKAEAIQRQGEIHQQFGYTEKALESFQHGISILSSSVDSQKLSSNPQIKAAVASFDLIPLVRSKAHSLKILADEQESDSLLEFSLQTYVLTMDMISEVRSKFRSAKSQEIISANYSQSIEEALELCFELYQKNQEPQYLNQALRFMEQNKASLLQANLKELQARKSLGLPDSLLMHEAKINDQLADARTMLYREESEGEARPGLLNTFKQEIFRLEEEQRKLVLKLEREYPDYYQMKYENKVVSLHQLQKKLQTGELLLEYYWGKNQLYILAITSRDLKLIRLEKDRESNNSLISFIDRLKDRKRALEQGLDPGYFADLLEEGQTLYNWLIKPTIQDTAEIKSLIIIPDGMLNYLPFEALLMGKNKPPSPNYSGLPYVVTFFPVHYRYSAALFLKAKSKDKMDNGLPLLAIAPDYQTNSNFPVDIEKLLSSSETRDGVSPLAYNQDEAMLIGNSWGGQILAGASANEATFKKLATEAGILHLAMHAFSDDENPMHSGLIFNPDSSVEEDGILYAHEIYNMNLHAEMVILSACNTGAGQLTEGEGVMSLARSFAYAGCPSTTMSLWQADDEAIASVMQSYHKYLYEGMKKSVALRKAKLDFLQSSDRTHPYFWAAFMTIGDDEPVSDDRFPSWGYLIIFLILSAGGWLLWKRLPA